MAPGNLMDAGTYSAVPLQVDFKDYPGTATIQYIEVVVLHPCLVDVVTATGLTDINYPLGSYPLDTPVTLAGSVNTSYSLPLCTYTVTLAPDPNDVGVITFPDPNGVIVSVYLTDSSKLGTTTDFTLTIHVDQQSSPS